MDGGDNRWTETVIDGHILDRRGADPAAAGDGEAQARRDAVEQLIDGRDDRWIIDGQGERWMVDGLGRMIDGRGRTPQRQVTAKPRRDEMPWSSCTIE